MKEEKKEVCPENCPHGETCQLDTCLLREEKNREEPVTAESEKYERPLN